MFCAPVKVVCQSMCGQYWRHKQGRRWISVLAAKRKLRGNSFSSCTRHLS